jgi:hypothetical protein
VIEKDDKCPIPNCYLFRIDKINMNGLYKIYAKDDTIFGAKLSGEIFDEESANTVFDTYAGNGLLSFLIEWLFKPSFSRWANNKIKKRYELEEYYNTFEFDVNTFLNKDKGNFAFNKCDIEKVKIFTKRASFATLYRNEGTIVIETNQVRPMKFVVIGMQSMRYIARIFSDLGIIVEVKDKGLLYNKF